MKKTVIKILVVALCLCTCMAAISLSACTKCAHTESDWVIDESPTCKDKGLKHKECNDCGVYMGIATISTLPHEYIDGKCVYCKEDYYTKNLQYVLNEKHTGYILTGMGSISDKDIVVPSKYNGLPVVAIADNAFSGCRLLTSIEIPNSVTSIGVSAFSSCTSLTSIEIPNSVTSIRDGVFTSCYSLTSIEIPNSITSIGNYAFNGCESLTNIEIPNSVTNIGNYTFGFCSSLTNIEIPDSVTSIGYSVFHACSSLTSIEIPNSITSIGDYAFMSCNNLTNVYYGGTATEWAEISIKNYYNLSLTNATRYYFVENENDLPADNGNYWHYVDGVPTIWATTEE